MLSTTNNFISYMRQAATGLKHIKDLRLSSLGKVFSLMDSREKTAFLLLAIVAATTFFFSSRNTYYSMTVPVPTVGGSFTEGVLGQPVFINPILAYQEPDTSLNRLVYSGLYRYDSEGVLVPDLAESMPEISEDQKQYTVKLKQNVKWHNQQPFSADDVLFTFNAIKDPAYRSPLRTLWLSTSVEKTDDYTVKFTTKDVSGPFIHNLTQPIVSHWVWSSEDPGRFTLSDKNLYAIGTGPYSVREIEKLRSGKIQKITLDSFRHYHLSQAKTEHLTVKFYDNDQDLLNSLHSGEIEGFGFAQLSSAVNLGREESLHKVTAPMPQYQTVFFNTTNPALSDAAVRRALALATDKQAIISEVFGGNALLPVWPAGVMSEYNTGPNTELARQTLDTAGWTVDPITNIRTKKGIPLELAITTNDSPLNSKAAELLAKQWTQLHANITVNTVSSRQLSEENIKSRKFDVLLFPQKIGSDPDPFIFWHSSQKKDPGLNLTGFDNPAADKLITEARTTTDQNFREQKYREFYELLNNENPALLLNQTQYVYIVNPKYKNASLTKLYDASHRYLSLPNWYIEEKRVFQ